MIEAENCETYLSVSKNKFQIFLFDKKNSNNLYVNELKIENKIDFIDLNNLSKFLEKNVFKIEKLSGQFIKNIFLIIENNENLYLSMGIKKKNYDETINQKYLENTLTELKDLFKENYQEQTIMHMCIKNYLVNEKNYSSFVSNLSGDNFCLEVNFISISNNLIFEIHKVLEKYQINISQYLDGNYVKFFINEDDIAISQMAYKLRNGYNHNEIILVPKNIRNKGFFEKFFQLFG